jgi:hypothetical protein
MLLNLPPSLLGENLPHFQRIYWLSLCYGFVLHSVDKVSMYTRILCLSAFTFRPTFSLCWIELVTVTPAPKTSYNREAPT